ncbi:hypothetical protein ANCDUO_02413 [Ancylostoma duodenale]|uniref:Uncharacterized protein n=1 Tax=Ancylostoma duodenale TaxID=51022 RepID=A0A0C2DBQ9_9BILA|nr:hypothetical protein ANCDUO_02413 [Ancylostoma duodenale]
MASDGFEKDVDLLLKDEALPRHLRTDIATLLEDRKLLGTALNRNLLSRKETVSMPPNPSPPKCSHDEHSRCVVVIGMRESAAELPSCRVIDDIYAARHLMDFLGIECSPVSTIRMGRYNRSHPRLLKIVLPSSFHARQMLQPASRLRNHFIPKLFIRPSLPKAERDRLKAERVARHNSTLNRNSTPPPIVDNLNVSSHSITNAPQNPLLSQSAAQAPGQMSN